MSCAACLKEAIREWVGAHTGNWNESTNGANACSVWDSKHASVCKGKRMRLQQTFGIMYASDGAELATLMRADPIGMYLAFAQDTSFPSVTPAQLHAAAHPRVVQEKSRQGLRARLREPWTSIAGFKPTTEPIPEGRRYACGQATVQ